MVNKQENEKLVKHRILEAAKQEFAEMGFQGARTSRIASEAQVNKAMIHYYFKDKEGLYKEVLRIVFGVNENAMAPILSKNWDISLPVKLHAILYFLFKVFTEAVDNYFISFFFWELVETKQYLSRYVPEYVVPKLKAVKSIIDEGLEEGIFETENSKLLVANLFYFPMIYVAKNRLYSGRNIDPEKTFFGEDTAESVFSFHLSLIFKALCPSGRKLAIPELPSDLKEMLDSLIEFMVISKQEGNAFKIINQLEKILTSKNIKEGKK